MSTVARRQPRGIPAAAPWALAGRRLLAAHVQLALLLVPLAVIPFFRLVDNDFWWHLKTGELIVERGLFSTDPYSWTAPGKDWVLHEWLAEALIFALQRSLGYWANCLAFAAAAIAALLVVHRTGRSAGASARPLLLSMAAAVVIMSTFVTVRPQVFSWLLFATFLHLLHQHTLGRPARVWLLPALMAVWANLHLGFFFGFMLLGAWVAATALRALRGDWSALRTPLAVSAACVAAACINPAGPGLLLYPIRYLTDAGATHQYVREWQSPGITNPFHAPIFLGIFMLAASLLSKHRPSAFLLIVSIAVIALGLQAVRNAPFVALMLPPVAGVAIARAWGRSTGAVVTIPAWHAAALLAVTVTAISALFVAWSGAPSLRSPGEHNFPSAAAGYVQREHPDARMFNEYGAGGFLIYKLYPRVPVAIDGRSEFYGNRILSGYYTIFRAEDGWAALLDEWGADLALISPQSPLAKALRADAAWVEEFTDEEASVFVRRAAAGEAPR